MIKALKRAHPITVFVYFLSLFLFMAFSRHPWMTAVQTISLIFLYLFHNRNIKKILPFAGIVVVVAITNPLFVQRGRTIWYANAYLRITKEAFLYGVHYGCVLADLLILFSIFNLYFKKEQWIYISGKVFPKLGVITSMAFALVPRYQRQAKKILKTRKNLKEETKISRMMHTVSMETTWAFESSMDQLDSMNARGYGVGKRTHFHLFVWERKDWIHIIEIIGLTLFNTWAYTKYYSRFFFYPMIIMNPITRKDIFFIVLMGIQFLLPFLWRENFNVRN